MICEKCSRCNCECVPYDVECDKNFKEKKTIGEIKEMPKNDGYENLPTIGDTKKMLGETW